MLVDRQDGEPKALQPISKLEHGFWPSESCREVRVGTWPRLVLLQSFHLAAMNLHMLLLHPGHFKQTGISAAVCQTGRGTGGSGHLQAGHRWGSTRDLVTVQKDKNALSPGLQGPFVSDNLPIWPLHRDEYQAWCRVVSKGGAAEPWVTQVLQSWVCHASPMN